MTTTSPSGKLQFLLEHLHSQIEVFERRRRRNKRRAFWLKIATVALSVTITILLGIHTENPSVKLFCSNAALVIAGSVSILGAWDAFFNHKELWIRYKRTANELKGLQSVVEYRSKSENGISEKDADALFIEFETILRQTNADWQQMRDERKLLSQHQSCDEPPQPHQI